MKKYLSLLLALMMLLTLAACGKEPAPQTQEDAQTPAAVSYEKTPVFHDVLPLAFMGVRLYQMKPVVTTDEADVSDKTVFLQCYVNANADNGLGYPSGAFVPGLLIEFEILDDSGTAVQAGRFQPLNAADGPCYGANLSLKDGAQYSVHLTLHNPQKSGYGLILDANAGPDKTFDEWLPGGTVEITQPGWSYQAP